ncbi:MAG: 16S rRNA (guanine(527)-N(7))-methyltransferase RsmG [Gammaproteobacteria bacterium]|nr:16S rRNA (guanine(527)-N(7))-methyltransferase RsmG [Gammaproteobacteria bacterium]
MPAASCEALLRSGIDKLQLDLREDRFQQLLAYHGLLQDWNKAYNLTSIRDPEQMIVRHLLDSLSVVHCIREEQVLDLGTGAGLPGLVLAIVYPDKNYQLLDSNGKKTRFINQVKIDLGLKNVTVAKSRAETYQPQPVCQAVTSRAFATLSDSIALLSNLLMVGGRFYAMKAKLLDQELKDLPDTYSLEKIQPINVPFLAEDRHLVIIKRLD